MFYNATLDLRFYVGIPHRVLLAPRITGLCQPEPLAEAIEGGRTPDPKEAGLPLPGTKAARKLRRDFLKAEIDDYEPPARPGPVEPPFADTMPQERQLTAQQRADLERIRKELKELEKFDKLSGEDEGD